MLALCSMLAIPIMPEIMLALFNWGPGLAIKYTNRMIMKAIDVHSRLIWLGGKVLLLLCELTSVIGVMNFRVYK